MDIAARGCGCRAGRGSSRKTKRIARRSLRVCTLTLQVRLLLHVLSGFYRRIERIASMKGVVRTSVGKDSH